MPPSARTRLTVWSLGLRSKRRKQMVAISWGESPDVQLSDRQSVGASPAGDCAQSQGKGHALWETGSPYHSVQIGGPGNAACVDLLRFLLPAPLRSPQKARGGAAAHRPLVPARAYIAESLANHGCVLDAGACA